MQCRLRTAWVVPACCTWCSGSALRAIWSCSRVSWNVRSGPPSRLGTALEVCPWVGRPCTVCGGGWPCSLRRRGPVWRNQCRLRTARVGSADCTWRSSSALPATCSSSVAPRCGVWKILTSSPGTEVCRELPLEVAHAAQAEAKAPEGQQVVHAAQAEAKAPEGQQVGRAVLQGGA